MGSSALALLLGAMAMGVGCGSDTPASADTGVTDVGETDATTLDDTGNPVDTGARVDTGSPVDTGVPVDGGATDAGDSGAQGDGGVPTDGGDGGATRRAHGGASLVSAGSLMRSARFQMISTLGGRSVQQTTLQSPNFRLRGGLVGTIGAR